MNDSKDEKYKKDIELRVSRILKDIRLVGTLAKRHTFTECDVNKICTAIENKH